MKKEFEDMAYDFEGEKVLNLWKMLFELQKQHDVDFWDYYKSDGDFDNWRKSKGYGDTDPDGVRHGASNIWYKEWQNDINNGLCVKKPYCCFIDMFEDDIQNLGADYDQKVYTLNLDYILEKAKIKDLEKFGKDDYRVHLATILIEEFGNKIFVDQSPDE